MLSQCSHTHFHGAQKVQNTLPCDGKAPTRLWCKEQRGTKQLRYKFSLRTKTVNSFKSQSYRTCSFCPGVNSSMQLSYREEYVEVRDITVNMEFRQQLTMQQSTQPVTTYLGITHKVVDGVEPKVSTTIVETNWTVESGLFLTRLLYSNVVHVVTHTFTSISMSVFQTKPMPNFMSQLFIKIQ